MTQEITLFRAGTETLRAHQRRAHSKLKGIADHPLGFVCQDRPKNCMRRLFWTGTSPQTAQRVAAFVEQYQDWFLPTEEDKDLLFFISRKYPLEASGTCAKILRRLEADISTDNPRCFRARQDLCFLTREASKVEAIWLHTNMLPHFPSSLEQFLAATHAEKSAEGNAYFLPEIPSLSLHLALNILYAEEPTLPPNPAALELLLKDASAYSHLLDEPTLAQKISACMAARMDDRYFFDSLAHIDRWDSPLHQAWISYLSFHFERLSELDRFHEVPPELMALVLQGDELMVPESTHFASLLTWADARAKHMGAQTMKETLLKPVFGNDTLLDYVRFEHFDLEDFIRTVGPLDLLSPEAFRNWVNLLADRQHGTLSERIREPRGVLRVHTHHQNAQALLRWHCQPPSLCWDVDSAPQYSPSFSLDSQQWKLGLEPSEIGWVIGLKHLPDASTSPSPSWTVTYHFPQTGASHTVSGLWSESQELFFALKGSEEVWQARLDPKTGILPIELEVHIGPPTHLTTQR